MREGIGGGKGARTRCGRFVKFQESRMHEILDEVREGRK